MRNRLQGRILSAAALLTAGMALAGCKSAPDLSQSQALELIQADYDHNAPQGISIQVNNDGMVQGAQAKYWSRTTIYPNKYWADFKLTDEGKKIVTLPNGGDKIEWRPGSLDDTKYTYRMVTVQANHLKARSIGDISDEMIAGVDAAKGADWLQGATEIGSFRSERRRMKH